VILLVEADETLRAMAGTVLENAGYTVRRAANSREAINIAGRLSRVDLLLSDAVMPEMTGKDLGVWLCASRPHMKVLFTSAVDDDKSAQQGAPDTGADILRKPYTPAILAERIRTALGEGEPQGAKKGAEKIAEG
jgi:DNA-binding response OmpR family regulator